MLSSMFAVNQHCNEYIVLKITSFTHLFKPELTHLVCASTHQPGITDLTTLTNSAGVPQLIPQQQLYVCKDTAKL